MRKILSGTLIGALSLVAATFAQAQTFTWSGPSSFNDASQNFGTAFTANQLNINSTIGFFSDNNIFGSTRFNINLVLSGGGTRNIYSQALNGGASVALSSLPVFSFLTSSIVGIQFTTTPDTLPTGYNAFNGLLGLGGGRTTFAFSNTAIAVPGPIAGAGLLPFAGLGAAWFARRRKQRAA